MQVWSRRMAAGADDADHLAQCDGLPLMDEWVDEHVAVAGDDSIGVFDVHVPSFSAPRKSILVGPTSSPATHATAPLQWTTNGSGTYRRIRHVKTGTHAGQCRDTILRMTSRRSCAQVWASVLIFLSAAMGIAVAVVADTVIGSINEQFDRNYGSPPTGAMTFGVAITIIVSVLMIAFGVWYYFVGSRTDSAAVTAAWVLFGIVVCTAFFTPGWFTGAILYSDPGGSGMFRWSVFVKLIPNWLPTTSLTLAIGKVVTFFAAALVLSAARSRAAAPAVPPAPSGPPVDRG